MDQQDLIHRIESNLKRMSKGQKLISEYILNNYDKAAFMTASKLGETVGVSESTVVRFANMLNYDGYPKLQKALQAVSYTHLDVYKRQFLYLVRSKSTSDDSLPGQRKR